MNPRDIFSALPMPVTWPCFVLKMEVEFKFRFRRRKGKKTAVCFGEYFSKMDGDDNRAGHKYVIKYKPVSPLNYYILSQYFLQQSMSG